MEKTPPPTGYKGGAEPSLRERQRQTAPRRGGSPPYDCDRRSLRGSGNCAQDPPSSGGLGQNDCDGMGNHPDAMLVRLAAPTSSMPATRAATCAAMASSASQRGSLLDRRAAARRLDQRGEARTSSKFATSYPKSSASSATSRPIPRPSRFSRRRLLPLVLRRA